VIEHIVLFKVKPDTTPAAAARMLDELRLLPRLVPGIVELSCGRNFSSRSQGYSHGLLVRFNDRADLERYIVHPEHQRVVAESVRPVIEEVLAVDYEV
jgi:hypothetical protein